jgi:HEPN domain-containing protein
MNALTAEWVDKAEGDFRTATRETRVRKAPNYDAACFHCQQCVEKYVKAYLQERKQAFRPVHDLIELLELCLLHDGSFELQRELLESLNKYAVSVRYPGESATKDDARNALSTTKTVKTFIRQKLGL